jgi:hypothetical protein
MTIEGLSLFGFIDDRDPAHKYLKSCCILADPSDTALDTMWSDAKARLGSPIAHAGDPDTQDLPPACNAHLQRLQHNSRLQQTIEGMSGHSFKLIEIAPLLAFQLHVKTAVADGMKRILSTATNSKDLTNICLPERPRDITCEPELLQNGFILRTREPNLRVLGQGQLGTDPQQQVTIAGIAYGESSPLVQVVRFQGRCYLKNGYHRAYAIQKAGATHMPCILLDAPDYSLVGAAGMTFSYQLLQTPNPPTFGHYVASRGYAAELKPITRIIQVTWSDVSVPDLSIRIGRGTPWSFT